MSAKIRLIIRFGSSLIRTCPVQVALYVLLSFISQTLIPLALPVLAGGITNAVQQEQQLRQQQKQMEKQQLGCVGKCGDLPGGAQVGGSTEGIVGNYGWWFVLTFAAIPLAVASRWAQTETDNRMEKQVRERLFAKVIRQVPEFFQAYDPGRLSFILTQTSVEAQQAFRSLTVDPLLQFSSICVATWLIVSQLQHTAGTQGGGMWVWFVVIGMVLFGVLCVVVVQIKGQKPVDIAQRQVQEQRYSLASLTDSAVKSPEEIQGMDAEGLFSQRYSLGLTRLMTLKRHQILIMEYVNSVIGLPTQILLAFLYGYVVYRVIHSGANIELGVFVALAGLAPQLMQPFKAFAFLGIVASSSWPAIEVVTKLLEGQTRIKELPGAEEIDSMEPTLEVRNVDFGYPSSKEKIFKDLTFSVPTGRITSLVAKMGQGKSTFFRLALRFYDPDSGQIIVGSNPTTALKLDCLRRQVVMMSQFPAFFYDSVRDNFRVAKPDANDEEIRALCEKTGLWSILEDRIGPKPLDRPFAAGRGLSGGQNRLFALTRCLLRNPRILFLDEPTTNMDNNEKYQLIPVMREACAGITVIVVDHDISWLISFADHFVVMDGGRIVQQGTAEELLPEEGVLKQLYSHVLLDQVAKTPRVL